MTTQRDETKMPAIPTDPREVERLNAYAEAAQEAMTQTPDAFLLLSERYRIAAGVKAVADEEQAALLIRGDQWKDAARIAEAKLAEVRAAMRCAAVSCPCGGDRAAVPTAELLAILDGKEARK